MLIYCFHFIFENEMCIFISLSVIKYHYFKDLVRFCIERGGGLVFLLGYKSNTSQNACLKST